jgi:hypothetical protein
MPLVRRSAALLVVVPLLLATSLSRPGTAQALPADVPLGSIGFVLEVGGQVVWSPRFAGRENEETENPHDLLWSDGSWSGNHAAVRWNGVDGDLDPGVSGVWSITNNTGSTQIYSFSVILPVLPVTPSSLMFLSSTVSVSDANFAGGASLASVGSPLYTGLIDLAPVGASALFAHPYSLVAPLGSTVGDTETAGVFPGSIPGPPVSASIGIQHVFSLTAGDSATLNSTFFLVAIPEPATLGMALLGVTGLATAARRSRSGSSVRRG